ncbi:HEPN domain-containing protein [Pedobacter sp. UBA4863]|uniref:HEPN domain-containing protein n=1 Tax=Pedobacter sp. UBA4863 TaxID=1947060 RepID=UPI0025D54BAB|nr:HEPN domain-containing protein [Pedobacter sp. UBA4863]
MQEATMMYSAAQNAPTGYHFNEFTKVNFEGVINFLKQTVPIGSIYNLSRNPQSLDLMVVLEKSCGEALANFEDLVDIAFLGYPNSVCTLHSYGGLNQQLLSGSLFYSWACNDENIVYRKSNAETLAKTSVETYLAKKSYYNRLFKIEMIKACSFLDGATHFMALNRFELAVFMLQQAVELTYRCFLNLMRGKDIKCHELYVLRRNIKRFAPTLIGVFSDNEEEELHYLDVLGKGYCDARYNREYKIGKDRVIFLHQKVKALHSRSFELFASMMLKLDKYIDKYE